MSDVRYLSTVYMQNARYILCSFIMRLLIFFKNRRLSPIDNHLSSIFLRFSLSVCFCKSMILRPALNSAVRPRTTHACSISHNWICYTPGRYHPTSGRAYAKLTSKFSISTYSVIVLIFPTVCKLASRNVSMRANENFCAVYTSQ